MFLGDLTKFAKLVKAGVDEEHVDPACLGLHGFVNAINVSKIRRIALNGSDVAIDCRDGFIQLGSASARNEHESAFLGEKLSGTKANARAPTGNDCYFVFEFSVHR